jgi:DNA-binding transcriptional ArsR family regulator
MKQNIKKLVGYVYSSELRIHVLKFLSKKSPARPMEIVRGISKYQSHVSNVLKEFEQKGLVECLTPEKGSWRAFALTKIGKKVLKMLEKFSKKFK